jgi:hypothetical protein
VLVRNDPPTPVDAAPTSPEGLIFEQVSTQHTAEGTLLAGDLPWTRMRQAYALLGLARRYGDARINAACETALAADMLSVRRLARLHELATPPAPPPPARVLPLACYLRPSALYALPPAAAARRHDGDPA